MSVLLPRRPLRLGCNRYIEHKNKAVSTGRTPFMYCSSYSNSTIKIVDSSSKAVTTLSSILSYQRCEYDGHGYVWLPWSTGFKIIDRTTQTVSKSLTGLTTGGATYSCAYDGGSYMWVCDLNANRVVLVDIATQAASGITVAATRAKGICKAGDYMYVVCADQSTVKAFNISTQAVTNITVGGASADGEPIYDGSRYVYVCNTTNTSTVSVIDTTNNTVLKTIAKGAGTGIPRGCWDGGNYIYIPAGPDNSANSITVVDVSTQTVSKTITGISSPASCTWDHGNYIWVGDYSANVSLIGKSTQTVDSTVALGSGASSYAVGWDGA